jgi:hypothetical protein
MAEKDNNPKSDKKANAAAGSAERSERKKRPGRQTGKSKEKERIAALEAELAESEDALLRAKAGPGDKVHFPLKSEKRDFLDAVKSRGPTLEDAEVGHRTTSVCLLGLIPVQTGRRLRWDPARERFPDDAEANRLLHRPPLRESVQPFKLL